MHEVMYIPIGVAVSAVVPGLSLSLGTATVIHKCKFTFTHDMLYLPTTSAVMGQILFTIALLQVILMGPVKLGSGVTTSAEVLVPLLSPFTSRSIKDAIAKDPLCIEPLKSDAINVKI